MVPKKPILSEHLDEDAGSEQSQDTKADEEDEVWHCNRSGLVLSQMKGQGGPGKWFGAVVRNEGGATKGHGQAPATIEKDHVAEDHHTGPYLGGVAVIEHRPIHPVR